MDGQAVVRSNPDQEMILCLGRLHLDPLPHRPLFGRQTKNDLNTPGGGQLLSFFK